MPRKIIVYIATSADGYIARPDGDFSWLNNRKSVKGDYGIAKFYRRVDTAIMGRKTYDLAVKMGQPGYPGLQNYVFSRTAGRASAPHIQFTSDDPGLFAQKLRKEKGKHVWLVGGAEVIASFLDAGGIDEFIIHVIPLFIGAGIPLIAPRHRSVELKLLRARRYSDGVVRLHYRVAK
jgi:dihydrofolate reductase